MGQYILRRILYAVPTLLGVMLFTFVLFYVVVSPETMARRNLTAKNPKPAQIKAWLVKHGYDKSRPQQFADHVTHLALLDFGKSDSTGEDIWERIRRGASPSFLLAGLVFTASLLVSVTLALVIAYYRATYLDIWGTIVVVFVMSVVYMVYIIAGQYLFGKILRLFPVGGYRGGMNALRFVLLPMIIGVISGVGSYIRFYRTVMLDEMGLDYVRTARAKGVSEQAILFKHVLKNAMVPILTQTVVQIPQLILGSLLLESFFGIPGQGGFLFDAINSQDFAVIRAMTYLGALMLIVGYILTDISYALFDPRVRLE